MRLRTKLAAVAAGAVVATGGLVLPTTAVAAPTGAAACTQPGWSNKDNAGGSTNSNAVNIRSGPTTECVSHGQAQMSHSLTLHCWVSGQSGTWSHVRDNSTGVSGWIKDSLLNNNGAANRC